MDEFYVTLDEDDLAEAYRPAPRPRRIQALLLVLALMLGLLIAILVSHYPGARSALMESKPIIGLLGAVILAASLVALLLLAAPALRRRAARSTLDHHPGMRDPSRYRLDNEFFDVRSAYTTARYPWQMLWDWRESERVVIIQPTPRHFYVIPKRSVAPDVLDRLRGRLARARCRSNLS